MPELEWRLAARWTGYTYQQFAELDGEEQSAIVATYRSHNQIEAVLAQEQAREMERRGKQARNRGKH